MGREWQVGGVAATHTVSMNLTQAVAFLTDDDPQLPGPDEVDEAPTVCSMCGSVVRLSARHADFHVALGVIAAAAGAAADERA